MAEDVRIDPDRQRAAGERVKTALRNAEYHMRRADAERAKAEQLARTWDLRIVWIDGGVGPSVLPAGEVT